VPDLPDDTGNGEAPEPPRRASPTVRPKGSA